MKKSKKLARKTKVISIFVAALLIVGTLITILPSSRNWLKADAAGNTKLTQLQQKFPHGTYWNHVGGSNNPDGYTNTPCPSHSNCGYYPNNCSCNSFSNAIQCHGFAIKLTYDYYGSSLRNWSKVYNLDSLKAGDAIRYKNDGHTIWVTAVNGDTITYADCNSDGKCKIRWNQKISKSSIYGLTCVYVAPSELTDSGASTSLTAPVVTTSNKYYAENAQVTVNWNAVSGATDYWFVIWRDGQQIFSQSVGNTTSYTFNTTKGDYGIYVIAGNGSTNAQSECCQFYVGKLDTPVVTTSNKYYAENAQVTINWDSCEGATGYWVHIWKDGENIVNQSVNTATSYSLSTTNGFYEVYVEAFSEAGGWQTVSSDVCTFYSGYLEKPIVTTSNKYYAENVQVTINWDSCEGATGYWVHVWKDGENIVNQSVNTATSYSLSTTNGVYEVCVEAFNESGGWQAVISDDYIFYVLSRPEKAILSANVNQSTKKVKFNWTASSGADFYDLRVFQNDSEYKFIGSIEDISYELELPAGEYTANIASVSDKVDEYFSFSDKINFTVLPNATSVKLGQSSVNVNIGSTIDIIATVNPTNSSDSVTWKSSNTKIATVSSSGQVKAVGLGRATITATAGKASATCTVDVVPDISLTTLGASIRISDPYGIRYGIQLKKDSAYKSTDIVEYGTLIIASGTLGNNELTIDTKSVRRIPAEVIYQEDSSQLTYTGVLINIPTSFFGTNVKGRGYLIYRDVEGVERVMYSAVAEKNFYGVAQSAYDSYSKITNPTAEQTAVIKKLKEILANR